MEDAAYSRLAIIQQNPALRWLSGGQGRFSVTAEASPQTWDWVDVLVIGAGGVGGELLHVLAMSGFSRITVIDMDRIELSNLGRQFLFRKEDVGQPKSCVAAAAIAARCPGVEVVSVFGRVEDQPDAFLDQFPIVMLAVDSIEARRWINRKFAELGQREVVPIEDGGEVSRIVRAPFVVDLGTEGYQGHCRVIHLEEHATPCIECEMFLYDAPRREVPMCTLANTPRSAEHCVLYAQQKMWPDVHRDEPVDLLREGHVQWLASVARDRQAHFQISGPPIDEAFVRRVLSHVVPSVIYTNAFVASQAVMEVHKYLHGTAPVLDNFSSYHGSARPGGIAASRHKMVGDSTSLRVCSMNGSCSVCGQWQIAILQDTMLAVDVLQVVNEIVHNPSSSWSEELCLQDGKVHLRFSLGLASGQPEEVLIFPTDAGGTMLRTLLEQPHYAAFMDRWRMGEEQAWLEWVGQGWCLTAPAVLRPSADDGNCL